MNWHTVYRGGSRGLAGGENKQTNGWAAQRRITCTMQNEQIKKKTINGKP